MSMKPKRTLGPAAFEAYMNFADSLKNGANNDSIDRFKYRFAVKEGYIRPKKAITEASGRLSLGDFETAFKGLVGGFLPHLDEEEQQFLGCVCTALDEKINSGDLSGATDVLKGAMRDAGGDTDEFDDDVSVDDDDAEPCQDGDECPEGEECQDGECVKDDDSDDDAGADEKPEEKQKPAEVECCQKANSAKAKVDSINMETPGFGVDDTESYSLDDESGDDVADIMRQNDEMDVYPSGKESKNSTGFSDYNEDFSSPSDVDYDKLADMILSDHGYGNMTIENGGVGARNRAVFDR